jgi:biopolymer transport protein ExbB/TolQ
MLILIPASIVAAASILRCIAMLWGRSVQSRAAELRAAIAGQRARGNLSLTDARTIAMDSAMQLYGALQPLAAIYAAAPIIGALGTLWYLGRAWRGPVSLQGRYLALALEHSFIPLGWGLVLALFSITGYSLLKARIGRVERDILVPAAIGALNDTSERKPGERKL